MRIAKNRITLMLCVVSSLLLSNAAYSSDPADQEPSYVVVGSGNYVPAFFRVIEDSEYEIRWQPRVGAYQSPNRANNLRFSYLENGFIAEHRAPWNIEDYWRITLTLNSYGEAEAPRFPERAALEVKNNTARVASGDLIFEYSNDNQGMRQNFIVHRRLGQGGLRLVLQADLEWVDMLIDEVGNNVYFANEFEEVMRYTDLKAWDAEGRVLPAKFEPVADNRFAIIVDDAGAQYPVTVDPLSYYWGTVGDQGGAHYGWSVAYGDFNGPFGDIIVGAPFYDSGNTDEGKVFVFYNGALGPPSTPDWTGEGDQANAHFGFSVAAADVNGDGYDDLIVGSVDHSVATQDSHEGRVFVWLASSTGSGLGANGNPSNASWSKTGENSNAKFGYSVASAGDVNGDGYKDIIIGAPHNDSYQTGKVYIYHGSSSGLSATPNWTASSGQLSDPEFGFSVASAGDVNGDGYGDIIIGAPRYCRENCQSPEGVALIWHGSINGVTPNPGTPSNAARLLEKYQASANFGYTVASAGDVNADGYSDVIVGAPYYDNGQIDEGAVFVYNGSPSGIPATESWFAESNQAHAYFGWSVAATELSVPHDGYSDIVVGAPYYTYAPYNTGGGVFMWYGSSTGLGPNGNPSNAADAFFDLTNDGAHGGWSVAAGPNIRYSQHGGIIIGAPDEASGGVIGKGGVTVWAQPSP